MFSLQSLRSEKLARPERLERTLTIIQTFKNPKPELLSLLRESGPVPGDENGAGKGAGAKGADAKKKRPTKNVDMEKLADGLQKLDEDNLLNVVQMIHDHKTSDTYTKNDVESKSLSLFPFFLFGRHGQAESMGGSGQGSDRKCAGVC